MKKFTMMVLFVLSVFSHSVLIAQTKAEKIDQLISKYKEYHYFNGSALVVDDNKPVLKKGYGMANMEWNIPNTPDTKFRLGSITKQFTSMLIMQLVEKGKIKLDGKLTDYLPYYREDTGGKVTVHMLLNHTSGIPSYTDQSAFMKDVSRKNYKPDDFIKEFCSGDLQFEPGTKWVYNNSGYFILGAIIEHATGMTYEEALTKNILEPLGLKKTGYDNSDPIIEKRAAGYEKTATGFRNSSFLDMSLPYAAGSMYSTVEDLYKWDKALHSDKLVTKKSLEKIFDRSFLIGGTAYYGYGWTIDQKVEGRDTLKVITHGGGINGFNTINYMIPAKGQYVILLSNLGHVPLSEMTNKIIDILNGKEVKMPAKSLAYHLADIIKDDGIETAVQRFSQLKDNKELFILKENEMNQLGYSYLGLNQIDEALAVFKLNVEAFPKSGNVYDSYGEALLKKGNKEEAIFNYKKAVELDPRNTGAVKILKGLGVNVEEPKEVKLTAEALKQFVGKYQLAPGFVLEITVNGEQIYAQATGQPVFEIFPSNENEFYLKVVNAQIKFVKEKGIVTQLVLFQNGREMPAKKIE
ncbi:MAG: serine hydrolase [Ignavibacteriae bacterium HGW-Ignavibacteriae-3]|nr:MAG: serine hydrolase [Ignavibacteriae bacterium HGW-Ignavibacteriae-3]